MKRMTCLLLLSLLLPGCTSRQFSNTPRAALEQLLLSGAVDKALAKFTLPETSGKKVFIDFTELQAYDVNYIKVATRARFAEMGAVLIGAADQADLIAEVASGGLGTEYKNSVVGIPSLPVPNAPIALPEAPLLRTTEQTGIFKLLIFVHADGRYVASGHYYGKYDRDERFILWWRFQRQDDVRTGWEQADAEVDLQASRSP